MKKQFVPSCDWGYNMKKQFVPSLIEHQEAVFHYVNGVNCICIYCTVWLVSPKLWPLPHLALLFAQPNFVKLLERSLNHMTNWKYLYSIILCFQYMNWQLHWHKRNWAYSSKILIRSTAVSSIYLEFSLSVMKMYFSDKLWYLNF